MRNNRTVGVISALSVLAIAGSAFAQGAAKQEGAFEKPLTVKRVAPGGGGSSTTQIVSVEGDDRYELSIVDGQVSAKINGKKVPEDRIRRSDGKVELLGRDGEVLHTFNVAVAGGHGGVHVFPQGEFRAFAPEGGQWRAFGGPEGQFQFFTPGQAGAPNAEPPKVMLGVTMNDAGDEAREEAGLEEGGIVIERVIEDLPAAKAGVKDGDLIIAVNGKSATAEQLRAILREKKPGDTITVRVKRESGEKNVMIELAEYDAEALGNTVTVAPMQGGEAWGASVEDMHKKMEQAYREALKNQPHGFQGRVLGVQPGEMQWFAVPGQGGDKRVAELSSRLDKLDERLAELDKRLERLAQTLEKLSER